MKGIPIDPQRIRDRAHALWLARGCAAGSAERDWQEAERSLLLEEAAPRSSPRPLPPRPTLERARRARVARLCNKIEHKLPAAAQPREVLAAEDVLAKPTAAGSR